MADETPVKAPVADGATHADYGQWLWEHIVNGVLGQQAISYSALYETQWLLYMGKGENNFLMVSGEHGRLKEYRGNDVKEWPKGMTAGDTKGDVYINTSVMDPLFDKWVGISSKSIGRTLEGEPNSLVTPVMDPKTVNQAALAFTRAGAVFAGLATDLNTLSGKLDEVADGDSAKALVDLLAGLGKNLSHLAAEIPEDRDPTKHGTGGAPDVLNEAAVAAHTFVSGIINAFNTWRSKPLYHPYGVIWELLTKVTFDNTQLYFEEKPYGVNPTTGGLRALWTIFEQRAKEKWLAELQGPNGLHALVRTVLNKYVLDLQTLGGLLHPVLTQLSGAAPKPPGTDVKPPGDKPPDTDVKPPGDKPPGTDDKPPGSDQTNSKPPGPPLMVNSNFPTPNLGQGPPGGTRTPIVDKLPTGNPLTVNPLIGGLLPPTANLGVRAPIGGRDDERGLLSLRDAEAVGFPVHGDDADGVLSPWQLLNPELSRQEMLELLREGPTDPQNQGGGGASGGGTSGMGAGGVPFFPPMAGGMGGMGGGQGQNDRERERTTWLAEDERVWGVDNSLRGATAIGRPDPDTEDEFEEYRDPRPARPGQAPNQTRGQR